ncbi:hypothetical protein [Bradyrhizobium sp.]|uniref:hypothetical protein n=1 Tax=Bradyrhizobium sp. TaxID=376 RepID=UPI001D6A0A22|nr:hypothetical protein [Bradyrhizobium sp.]MBV8701726.1 hypothetical protein [Bradyrhizobium sp.]MBV9978525.1 hypothetical protein [Bradyrhizobium sp.]
MIRLCEEVCRRPEPGRKPWSIGHGPHHAEANAAASPWQAHDCEASSELHDQLASLGDIEWIGDATRELVEQFMPDLAGLLPAKEPERFEQAFGRTKAKAKRKGRGYAAAMSSVSANQWSTRREAMLISAPSTPRPHPKRRLDAIFDGG